MDNLTGDLNRMLSESEFMFVTEKYPPPPHGEGASQALKRQLKDTTCFKFRRQMASLMTELRDCQPHYMRCIRPNAMKAPDIFHMDLVLTQLRYFGLMDIVKIRRLGFAEQITFDQFWNMYNKLLPDDVEVPADTKDATEMLAHAFLGEGDFKIGHQKIFLKLGMMSKLDQTIAEMEGRYIAKLAAEEEEAERLREDLS